MSLKENKDWIDLGEPPEVLCAHLDKISNMGWLTRAAEKIGERMEDSDMVRKHLLPLLHHEVGVVREGAIYGLTYHLNDKVRQELTRMAKEDRSPAIREVAQDALLDE